MPLTIKNGKPWYEGDHADDLRAKGFTVYRSGTPPLHKDFPVVPSDQVVVQTKEGPKSQGYNHSRAWSACLDHASNH